MPLSDGPGSLTGLFVGLPFRVSSARTNRPALNGNFAHARSSSSVLWCLLEGLRFRPCFSRPARNSGATFLPVSSKYRRAYIILMRARVGKSGRLTRSPMTCPLCWCPAWSSGLGWCAAYDAGGKWTAPRLSAEKKAFHSVSSVTNKQTCFVSGTLSTPPASLVFTEWKRR